MSKELAGRLSSMSNGKITEVLSYLIKESTDENRTFLHTLWTRKVKVLAKKRRREQTTANAAPIPPNSILQNPIFSEPLHSTSANYVPVLPEDAKTPPSRAPLFSNPKRLGQIIPFSLMSK